MTSSDGWTDDSVTKNKLKLLLKPKAIALATVGLILTAGVVGCNSFRAECETGLQKIDGQCIDPYFEPFQKAQQQGDKAIELAQNYTTIEDLQTAQSSLSNVFRKLNKIPPSAKVFRSAQNRLQTYKLEPVKINANLQKELQAQQKLTTALETATQASKLANQAQSKTQLNSAKQKWQTAQAQLKEIASDTLAGDRVGQLQSEYQTKITEIDNRLARLAKPIPPRVVPKSTRPKPIYRPKPKPKPKYIPKPSTKPTDPCAVPNPPSNCLF